MCPDIDPQADEAAPAHEIAPAQTTTSRPPADGGNGSSLAQLATTVLGALAAGVGGIGFVVAVGGVVTQARYRGAGLPSEQSVSVVPKGVLLAVGGEVLAVAILVALALVAAVHWSNDVNVHRLPEQRDAQGDPVQWRHPRQKSLWRQRWRHFFFALVLALALGYYLGWAGSEIDSLTQLWILLGVIGVSMVGAGAATMFASHAAKHRDKKPPDRRGEGIRLIGLFSTVTLLGGIVAAAGNLTNPAVRPAALLVETPPEVICGLYVGQTSDRVYIGEAVPQKDNPDLGDHSLGSLIEVNRSRVRRLVIGSSQPLTSAINRASALMSELQAPTSVPVTGCK